MHSISLKKSAEVHLLLVEAYREVALSDRSPRVNSFLGFRPLNLSSKTKGTLQKAECIRRTYLD